MKNFFLFFAALVLIPYTLLAQSKAETEIRKLEQLEKESIQKGDTTTLLKLWGQKYVCM